MQSDRDLATEYARRILSVAANSRRIAKSTGAPAVPPRRNVEAELEWGRITCATILVRGIESWASNPLEDGRAPTSRTPAS